MLLSQRPQGKPEESEGTLLVPVPVSRVIPTGDSGTAPESSPFWFPSRGTDTAPGMVLGPCAESLGETAHRQMGQAPAT